MRWLTIKKLKIQRANVVLKGKEGDESLVELKLTM